MADDEIAEHHHRHPVLLGIALVVLTALAAVGVWIAGDVITDRERQDALAPFYDPPSVADGDAAGDLIRWESVGDLGLDHGDGYRVLYWSETPAGDLRAASGMLFVPDGDPPDDGREVVAWAHGTTGLGDDCAPSRTRDPLASMTWVDGMLGNGWVVTATDYAGLGTPGVSAYLIGGDEARDVLNSVRTARQFPDAHAGTRFAVYGHSQGGHSSLWTADSAAGYAPELELVAAAAIAPAAELVPLIHLQYDTAVAWVIGPEVALAWPESNADLKLEPFLSSSAMDNYERLADECIERAFLEGFARQELLRESFFTTDPMTDDTWAGAATDQTPAPVTGVPLFVGESTVDEVVLPSTTALYVQRVCEAGGTVQTDWIDDSQGLGHVGLGNTFGPQVTTWLEARFAGQDAPSSCGVAPPVTPADPNPPTG